MSIETERTDALAQERGRRRRHRRRWTSLLVSGGDGNPFGTYRLRQLVVMFWPGVIGFAALGCWIAWMSVDINLEVGLPWWDEPLDTFGVPVLCAASGPVLMWLVALRRRFVVTESGVVIVGHFTQRAIPWEEIHHFDNVLGLVVETRDRGYPVDALENATLTHLRGRRDQADDLAAQLNRFLTERDGGVAEPEAISVDTAEGRSAIRWTAVIITLLAVCLGLLRLRYHF